MNSGVFGLNWTPMVGAVCGCLLAFGGSCSILWFKKRKREERNERPPQEEKILRPPGYFAMCRVEELAEKLVWVMLMAASAGMIFGGVAGTLWPVAAGWALGRFTVRQIWAAQGSEILIATALLGLVALLWSVRQFEVMWKLVDELRTWKFGLRGEQAVAQKLMDRELAAAGYVAFHDLPAQKGRKKWNVDHIVVGPGGVFVLETKTRPRRRAKSKQAEHEVIFDGSVLRFPWCYDEEAVGQALYNAGWVREYLGVYAPAELRIQPIIVVPGWFVPPPPPGTNFDVKVMNANYLVKFLKRAPTRYQPEQLTTVIKRLDDGCRSLEF
jgi:hypothetical protein